MSNSTGDEVYTTLENKIAEWTGRRDAIAAHMRALLEGAAFGGQSISEQQAKALIRQGQALLEEVRASVQELSDSE